MKDYFGHEINIGDIVLYNERGSKGYCSSFSEGAVIEFSGKTKVKIKNGSSYWTTTKYAENTVDLTALDIRQKVTFNEDSV